MNNPGCVFEAKFKSGSYDYISGNSDFYKFLGERLYTTFDSLITDGTLPALEKAVAERAYGKSFVLNLCDKDGQTHTMVCRISAQKDSDCVLIRMRVLDEVVDEYLSAETERAEMNALLSQRDCVYYSYDRSADSIKCYRFDGEKKTLCQFELEEFVNNTIDRLSEDSLPELERFADNLKNGIRGFTGCFSAENETSVIFSGTAIYDGDVHVKTVGSFSGGSLARKFVRRKDQLTGLILKEDITNYAKHSVEELKQRTVLAIIDIDDFKYVNDRHGHTMGDAVLKKCAAIIENETGAYGKAGRIGGDEFLVVFDNIPDKEALRYVLRGIKNNIANAYSDEKDGLHVSTSIGASVYPDDAGDYDSLFRLTDYMLYRAKHKGKNRYIFYEPDKHGTVEEILRSSIETIGITGRKGLSKAEAVCSICDMVLCGKEYPASDIIRDVAEHFGIERVILYDKTARTAVMQYGTKPLDGGVIAETVDYICDEELARYRKDGAVVINNVRTFACKSPELYEKLRRQEILSFMHREITGKSGKSFLMSCESVSAYDTWNLEDMRFYRILDNVLAHVL